MDNILYDQLLIMQDLVDVNKKYTDDISKKLNKQDSEFTEMKTILK